VAVIICTADVDFFGSSHFGLRDRKLFDSRATKSSWTEVLSTSRVRFTPKSGHRGHDH
jgi:hypothetical protein